MIRTCFLACAMALAGLFLAPAAFAQGSPGVVCDSIDGGYNTCPTPFSGRAALAENRSQTRCVEGRNWGNTRGGVWVDGGCRGLFVDARGGNGPGRASGQRLRCESQDGRYAECRLPQPGGSVQLVNTLSDTRCVQGRNWGVNRQAVWVNGGCRAEFAVQSRETPWRNQQRPHENSAYGVTCSSEDGRTAVCPWNASLGYPQIAEQLSSAPCIPGQTWGVRGRGPSQIWVANGCRARFGAR